MNYKLIFFFIISMKAWAQIPSTNNQNLTQNSNFESIYFPTEEFFQSLNSSHLKIFSQSETKKYESNLRTLNNLGFTWQPDWNLTENLLTLDDCSQNHFSKVLTNSSHLQIDIKSAWENCERKWRLNEFSPLTHAQQILRTQFESALLPSVRMLTWTLDNKIKIRGFLFLKGAQKRPLVIVRPGVFSHLKTSMAEKFILMQLFEEGPFHVMFLPGNTSQDYILDNHNFAINGDSEGKETFEILKIINSNKEPLNQWITQIHFVGISMGGQGLLKTLLLINESDELKNKNQFIGKSILLCPLIDLPSTLKHHNENWFYSKIIDFWFFFRLNSLKSALGLTQNNSLFNFKKNLIQRHLTNTSHPLQESNLPNITKSFLKKLTTLDFKKILLITTKVDPVIPPDINFQILSRLEEQLHLDLRPVILPRGFHCSLSSSYQWNPISTTLRGFLEPQSLNANHPTQSFKLNLNRKIKNIKIKNIYYESASSHKITEKDQFNRINKISIQLLITFINPLIPPQTIKILAPSQWTSQLWNLKDEFDLNSSFRSSLFRVISSHLTWNQSSIELAL